MKKNQNQEKRVDYDLEIDNIISASSSFDESFFSNTKARVSEKIKKPIFVVGSPRSGTTVLGKCIAAHPKLGAGEESLFLLHMWHIYSDLYHGKNHRNYQPLRDYTSSQDIIDTIGSFSDELFAGLLKKQDKERYLDHTPWYGAIASFIKMIYSDAVFIHIVRDGRKVVRSLSYSYKEGFKWAGSSMEHRIKIWINLVKASQEIEKHYPESYFRVNHIQLQKEPEVVFKKLFNFLDIEYNSLVLEPLSVKHANPYSSSLSEEKKHIDYDSCGWPREWKTKDKDLFKDMAGDLMDSLFNTNWMSPE